MDTMSREMRIALLAAAQAGKLIMRYYGHNIDAETKADATKVTQADLEAEEIIITTIREHFPHHSFLAEESGCRGISSDCLWVIDPIDGTNSFVRGIPLFGTQIALFKAGVPVLGVSHLPALGELLCAEVGFGSYMNGHVIHVSSTKDLHQADISLGSLNYFVTAGRIGVVSRLGNATRRMRAYGDAYAYHLLASGRCDAVLEARTHVWDIAALTVIVQEAGGVCMDMDGEPIGLNTSSTVCSAPVLHPQLMCCLRSA